MNMIPAFSTSLAKSAFSDKNPYPGCIAVAPDSDAIFKILSIERYVSFASEPFRGNASDASLTKGDI